MGSNPKSFEPERSHKVPTLDERREHILRARWQAQKAIRCAQEIMNRHRGPRRFTPYQKGNRVWVDATNIATTHPTAKLAPKRYGPFEITDIISPVVYKLKLLPTWKIHDVFHATLLAPYTETELHGPNYLMPPPDIIEGEPEWEV